MAKYTYVELMDTPRREVFEVAIRRLEARTAWYSCIALIHAIWDTLGQHPLDTFKSCPVETRYTYQYRLWVCRTNGGKLPKWWGNLNCNANKAARIAAIKGFAKACGYEL